MFREGDKVFYPMHGAGVIKAIEDREVRGEIKQYYILNIPVSNMDVMIPMNNIAKTKIRKVVDRKVMKDILDEIHRGEVDCELPWKEQVKQFSEKMKTGEIYDSAYVIRGLLYRQKEKSLNASEKQMLNDVLKIFISELSLIKDISEEEAKSMIKIS